MKALIWFQEVPLRYSICVGSMQSSASKTWLQPCRTDNNAEQYRHIPQPWITPPFLYHHYIVGLTWHLLPSCCSCHLSKVAARTALICLVYLNYKLFSLLYLCSALNKNIFHFFSTVLYHSIQLIIIAIIRITAFTMACINRKSDLLLNLPIFVYLFSRCKLNLLFSEQQWKLRQRKWKEGTFGVMLFFLPRNYHIL